MANKAVILAGGKGTRMLPLTEKTPKVLLEVNEKPFLYYLLENLKLAGYDDFGVIAGYKKEQIKAFLDDYGYNAIIIEQPEALGTADAVKRAHAFTGNDNFTVLAGDNLIDPVDLAAMNEDDGFHYIAGFKVAEPSKYGVLIIKEGKLERIAEKPKEFVGDLINTSLYRFTPEIFEYLDRVGLSARGEYEIVDAITMLANEKKVKVKMIKNYWIDFGCPSDIEKVEKFLNSRALVN